jgi:hypothetical protein
MADHATAVNRSCPRIDERVAKEYGHDMSYRQGGTPPMHGPGRFDDPFMIPEPSPRGEGPSQRRPALIGLACVIVVLVLLWLWLF